MASAATAQTAPVKHEPDVLQDPHPTRLDRLLAEDSEFRRALPLDEVVAAKRQPGLRLAQLVQIVMEGYADRPALGQRAREPHTDPATGRTTLRLLPRFDTITYRALWARSQAVAGAWHHDRQHPLRPGDFVCILGFTSPDYATILLACIHLGLVIVPLQTSAPAAQHADIIAETEPRILAASIDYLEAAIDAVLAGFAPQGIVVFDYDELDDDHRDALAAARDRLRGAGCPIAIETLAELTGRANAVPAPPLYVPPAGEDPLAWLFYTSGSTGTPKGAMFTQSLVTGTWLHATRVPAITLSFMPMSHLVGNGYMLLALANGGTSYCAPKSDLSTLFEDLTLARPTMASLVPRVCELLHHHYLAELDRRVLNGADQDSAARDIKADMRERMLGGRLLSVGCGSASLAPETYEFMESMLGMHMPIGYSATEIAGGTVLVDGEIQRPPVIAYKLADVPELGYFGTDKPYPRGELLVKSDRFMAGYYKRADLTAERFDEEGYYRTGDVMAETGPDRLIYLDRRNNVVKLSQGEFVAISRLEALYAHSPAIRQIYIYGNSARAFLLAVVVPSEDPALEPGQEGAGPDQVRSAIRRSLQRIADEHHLNSYEIPRDFLIETEPFSLANGLLSEIGKFQRPKLRERYAEPLEQLYAQIAQEQFDTRRALRADGAGRPVLETISRALQATLGVSQAGIRPDSRFADLGGDSLSALAFSNLLEEIFGVAVPVGVIVNPAGDIRRLADYIEAQRDSGAKRPSFATIHAGGGTTLRASELTLDKFIDAQILAAAPSLAPPRDDIGTVLLTGATGYLGRFLALAWLQRLATTGGRLVCLARGSDAAQARQRIDAAFDTDPTVMAMFRTLAADHMEVLPGDIALPNLGLAEADWDRLADTVDVVVHPAAHVNHVLPYNQLFTANVGGTAELIRLAITTRLKRVHHVSTLGINAIAERLVDEDADIRLAIPECTLDGSYANGYGVSKWASEVLLREAFDLCGMPVAVFRPGMILAHSRYVGQLNVPDMFTRLLFSLLATGIAPATFYAPDARSGRPRARYDGLPVDFLADSITEIGARVTRGFHSYNMSSPHEDGVSLDSFVDWLIDAGCPIERIESYADWLARFETALRALPEAKRQNSMLAILDPYRHHQKPVARSLLSSEKFRTAAEAAGLPIPPLSSALIGKYLADLRHLQLVM